MGMFDFAVVCIAGPWESVAEYIKWKFESDDLDIEASNIGYEARGKCFFKSGYVPVIWIPDKPKTPREYATLAHESIHAVMHLFDWAYLAVSVETEEVLTHATAHLVFNILEGLR